MSDRSDEEGQHRIDQALVPVRAKDHQRYPRKVQYTFSKSNTMLVC